jgi:hypothetical protein
MSIIKVNEIQNVAGTQNKGVLQVVSTCKTTQFTTTSTSFVDITGLNVAITPRSTSSKVLVVVGVGCMGNSAAGYQTFVMLERDIGGSSTNLAVNTDASSINSSAMWLDNNSYSTGAGSVNFLDSPSTTSAITYTLQCRGGGNTATINRRGDTADDGTVSTITAMEIQG